jgi:predicted Rossmann fold flavoprotein
MQAWDVIIIGAGAAGLMCAVQAGYRGRRVLVIDNAKKPGRKILVSGGGRCNFTNRNVNQHNYLCDNPHFVKSALARYSSQEFIDWVERHGIAYHERDHGQLFCDDSAKAIVDMLLTECDWAGVNLSMRCEIRSVDQGDGGGFILETSQGSMQCQSLVVATGGLSLPKLGATPYGYQLAEQFGLNVKPTRAGLVPFTWHADQKERFALLSGIALPSTITAANGKQFSEALLFTHRGLSGPAILQISNYWLPGEAIHINLLPGRNGANMLVQALDSQPKMNLKNVLSQWVPKRVVEALFEEALLTKALNQLGHGEREAIAHQLNDWQLVMNGTEGYRTAEVTLGGVDTDQLSSKTMAAKQVPGLYFIGEVMDVTGWLGGYNFQWAWSSGYAAGLAV